MRLRKKKCKSETTATMAALLVASLTTGCAMPNGDRVASIEPIAANSARPTAVSAKLLRLPPVIAPATSKIQLTALWQEAVEPGASQADPAYGKSDVSLSPPLRFGDPTDHTSLGEPYVIDLANALGLGGANSWEVTLAREKLIEARQKYREARVMWLPSLRAGVGYARHDGQLQATEGEVVQAGRNSLFVGGGAGLGNTPLPGGASGPPRLFVNLSLADVYFRPLAESRNVQAARAETAVVRNDELLEIAAAYFDLVEAEGLLANAKAGFDAANQMRKLVDLFAREGGGSLAEVDRANTEETRWRIAVEDGRRQSRSAGLELVRLLQLDPSLDIVPAEVEILPVELIDSSIPTDALIAQGLVGRPELARHQALICAALARLKQEHWRPWLPNLQAGATGGTFGGGPSSEFANQKGRGDVDLLAVWEWQHLGLGNHALQGQRASQVRQREVELSQWRDRIVADIASAAADSDSYRRQVEIAMSGAESASASYRRNLERIREGEGSPLELLQAIRARAETQDAYTKAVVQFNRAQARLLRAVGQPPSAPMEMAAAH